MDKIFKVVMKILAVFNARGYLQDELTELENAIKDFASKKEMDRKEVCPLSQHTIALYYAKGKISAIKQHRTETSCSLVDAKNLVEKWLPFADIPTRELGWGDKSTLNDCVNKLSSCGYYVLSENMKRIVDKL